MRSENLTEITQIFIFFLYSNHYTIKNFDLCRLNYSVNCICFRSY